MNNPSNVQQLLNNLQSQIATVASIAGQMNTATPETPAQQDLPALIQSLVAAELAKQQTATRTTVVDPTFATLLANNPYLAQQVAAMNYPTILPPAQIAAQSLTAPATVPVVETPKLEAPPEVPKLEAPKPTESSMNPLQTMQAAMMQDFLNNLKMAIGGGLTGDQQVWVTQNLPGLPVFLRTEEGRAVVQSVLTSYQKYVERLK